MVTLFGICLGKIKNVSNNLLHWKRKRKFAENNTAMTELLIQIDNNALIPSLKKVILSLKGVKDAVLTKPKTPAISPTAIRLLKDLHVFQGYKEGWDGDNARPLSPKVSKHFLQLLGKSSEGDLMDWNIFPELNGTLILENEKNSAQINLADKEFSYFKSQGNQLEGENHIKYSDLNLLRTIRKLNQ